MAEMTVEMMDLVNNMAALYLVTASKEGVPNVVSRGSTRAIDPDTITITALHLDKTFRNLEENPKVASVFHRELGKKGERKEVRGWQIKGEATLVKSGEYYKRHKEQRLLRRRYASFEDSTGKSPG